MKKIQIISNISYLVIFTSLLCILYFFFNFHKSSKQIEIEKRRFLPNIQYYTFFIALITIFQGSAFLIEISCKSMKILLNLQYFLRISGEFYDIIFLTINLFIFMGFWPIYFIKREWIYNKFLCENPIYSLDIILHTCPLIISYIIVFQRKNNQTKNFSKVYLKRFGFLTLIYMHYLNLLLFAIYLNGKSPYPFLQNNSIRYNSLLFMTIYILQGVLLYILSLCKERDNKISKDMEDIT